MPLTVFQTMKILAQSAFGEDRFARATGPVAPGSALPPRWLSMRSFDPRAVPVHHIFIPQLFDIVGPSPILPGCGQAGYECSRFAQRAGVPS